jgi:hypothetical protein
VDQLPGVFLEVGAGDADLLAALDFDPALARERQVVLRDLVVLGQVGVEVVLPVELRVRRDRAVERERGAQASSKAVRFRTGSEPGWPRQIGQTCVLGGAPNWIAQPQKSLVRVFSWTCVSMPATSSKSAIFLRYSGPMARHVGLNLCSK